MDESTAPSGPAPSPSRARDSASGPIWFGVSIVVLFFGVFGTWAALSPLDGAIVGEGVVTVDGNRKTVEHL